MPRSPRVSRLKRNALLSFAVSLPLLGILVLLMDFAPRRRLEPAREDPGVAREGRAPEGTQVGGEALPKEESKVGEEEEARTQELPALEPRPPMLQGRVTGEGSGLERASVILFSTRGVEEMMERLEDLAPQGEMPDVPALISSVLQELEAFKRSGIEARTAPDGAYEFRGIEPAGYFVLTLADGWLFRYGDVVSLSSDRTETLDLDLTRGQSITGRVVSSSGEGVPGVTVFAEFRPLGIGGLGLTIRRLLRYVNGEFLKGPFEAPTSQDGSFTFSSLPPGIYDLRATGPEGIEALVSGVETGTTEAVVYLGKGALLKGYLTDSNDLPIQGATLILERKDELVELPLPLAGFNGAAVSLNRLISGRPRKALSGERGGFEVGPLAPGKYKLSMEERGFLPFSRSVELDWGMELDLGPLHIDRGETLVGVVRAEDGSPVPGARLLATPAQVNFMNMGNVLSDFLSSRSTATTDASGTFRLAGLLKGQYRVAATARGYAAAVKKDAAAGGEPLIFQLKPGARVSGRVTESGGKPLLGARVHAGEIQTKTDEEGLFSLEGVAPSNIALNPFESMNPSFAAKDAAQPVTTVEISASAPGYLSGEGKIDLASGQTEVDIELEKAPEVKGTVFDPDGKPLAGSLVRLAPEGVKAPEPFDLVERGLIFLAVSLTDLEGKFQFSSFRDAKDDERYQVLADHPLYARGKSNAFKLKGPSKKGGPLEIEVHLALGGKVKGTVTNGSEPIAGAAVRLSKAGKKEQQVQQAEMFFNMMGMPKGGDIAYTSREGRFEYSRVLPGDYRLAAEVAGFTDSPEQALTIGPGDEREVNLVMTPGGEIAGVVVDHLGAPIAEARVRLFRAAKSGDKEDEMFLGAQRIFGGAYKTARSKEDGTFRIQGLPPSNYALSADHAGFSPRELSNLSPGKDEQRIVLVPSASLGGTVLDGASRRAITQFRVKVKPLSSEGASKTDEQDFEAYFLRNERDYNDSDGRFLRDDLEEGKYEVEVTALGYSRSRAEVLLTPGAKVEQEFDLVQAGRIRGVVLDLTTQAPIPGARVALSRKGAKADGGETKEGRRKRIKRREEEGARREGREEAPKQEEEDAQAMAEFFRDEWSGDSAVSREDGTFLLEGIPEGPQRVIVYHASYIPESKDGLEAGPGQEIEAAFLLRAGLTVSGKVSDTKGLPAPGKFVFLRGASEKNAQVRKAAVSGPDGDFQIGGLEKGTYRLVISESNGGSGQADSREIELRESESGLDLRVEN